MNRFKINDFPLDFKTIFLRVDFNVPLNNNFVSDNTKIRKTLPTIKYLLKKKCKIIIATHLGKPKGKYVKELETTPLVKELQKFLPKEKIIKFNDCIGKDISDKIKKSNNVNIFILENLRFYKEEEENDKAFAHSLASLADIYINEAFAVSHRQHASVCAITEYLPSLSGILLDNEIKNLNLAINPKKPAIWIMGGAKLNKVDLIEQALKKAEIILIGGALSFAFLKAQGIETGHSLTDKDSVLIAKELLQKKKSQKIILPRDFLVAEKISPNTPTKIVDSNKIGKNDIALDIGPKTIKIFNHLLTKANTIVWNGPLGYFEYSKFATGTKEIGRFLGKIEAIKISGGGETAEALNKFHLNHNFTHVSTGGGASLEFLSGKKMPALDALIKNYKRFRKKRF